MVHVKQDRGIMARRRRGGGGGRRRKALPSLTSIELSTATRASPYRAGFISRRSSAFPRAICPPPQLFPSRLPPRCRSIIRPFRDNRVGEAEPGVQRRFYRDRSVDAAPPVPPPLPESSPGKVTFPIIASRDMVISNEQDFN